MVLQQKQEELDKFKKSDKLKENITKTKNMLPGQWINSVRPGGKWDYKKSGKNPEMEHVGNFNYGATGRAAGYERETLLRAGGVVQIVTGRSRPEFGSPIDNMKFGNKNPNTSYGDDPRDQRMIESGMNWYDENYYEDYE